jgi:hypothetical protein
MITKKRISAPTVEDRQRMRAALALLDKGPATLQSLYDALGVESNRDRVALRTALLGTSRAKVSIYGMGKGTMACIGDPPNSQALLLLPEKPQEECHYSRIIGMLAKECANLIRDAADDGFPVNATALTALCKNEPEWRDVKQLLVKQGFGTCGERSLLWIVKENEETSND